MRKLLVEYVPGLVGGVVGGVLGSFLVYWISLQGFYAPVLPGALAGLGCGLASRTDSIPRGIACAVLAAVIGLVAEWIIFYRPSETTFANFQGFLSQFHLEPTITKLLLALGVFLGFWWGRECTLRGRLIRPQSKSAVD